MMRLTQRDLIVAEMMARGLETKEIARLMGNAKDTIRFRMWRISRALGLDRTALRFYLARYWECELFQIGLREIQF